MKTCSKCHKTKSLSDFYKASKGKYGVRSDCKECNNKKSRRYYKDNREKRLADGKVWRKNNPEVMKALKIKWYQSHKESVYRKVREWKLLNPEKRKIQAIVDQQRRKSRLKALGENNLSIYDVNWMLNRDGYKCLRCGSNKDLTVDHVIPIFQGGANNRSNIQTLCGKCNSSKGIKYKDYRSQSLPYKRPIQFCFWDSYIVQPDDEGYFGFAELDPDQSWDEDVQDDELHLSINLNNPDDGKNILQWIRIGSL